MSFLDKIASKIMPPESDQDRAEARATAQRLSQGDDWLATALDHHRQIEALFARALNAPDAPGRQKAVKELAVVLNGHAQAEEVVLYPALVEGGHKANATMAYEEQSITKVEMHLLEELSPMSQEWRDKLEHIQGAVQHHIYSEESDWFPDLIETATPEQRQMLTQRFRQEYERYAGHASVPESLSEPA